MKEIKSSITGMARQGKVINFKKAGNKSIKQTKKTNKKKNNTRIGNKNKMMSICHLVDTTHTVRCLRIHNTISRQMATRTTKKKSKTMQCSAGT